jgi:hypothetical protein
MDKEELRNKIKKLGVDLCGFGSVERMNSAPEGFRPRDVLPESKTVISFAIASPFGALKSTSPHPYTRIRNSISDKLNSISLDVCLLLEKEGYLAIPIPIEMYSMRRQEDLEALYQLSMQLRQQGLGR